MEYNGLCKEILERIKELTKRFSEQPVEVDTRLDVHPGFDEWTFGELACKLESEYGIGVKMKDTYNWRTPRDVARYVKKRLEEVA